MFVYMTSTQSREQIRANVNNRQMCRNLSFCEIVRMQPWTHSLDCYSFGHFSGGKPAQISANVWYPSFTMVPTRLFSIDSAWLQQDCRHFLKAIVDGLGRRKAFAARQLYRRIDGSIGKWLDRFVNRHRLLAFNDEFQ